MSKKDESKKSRRLFDKLKESGKEFMEGVKEEIETGTSSTREKTQDYATRKSQEVKTSLRQRAADTSTPDDIYYSTSAWFWTMVFGIFIVMSIFLFSIVNIRFIFVGLLTLIALPLFVMWCLVHMIPTVKIFGFTIFDRRQLSLQRQLTVGKEIARFFSREFLQESPIIAFFIFLFVVIFLMSILSALLA